MNTESIEQLLDLMNALRERAQEITYESECAWKKYTEVEQVYFEALRREREERLAKS